VPPQARRLGMPRLPTDPVTRHPTIRKGTIMNYTIVYSDTPRIDLIGRDLHSKRRQVPFTEGHRAALKEAASDLADAERIDSADLDTCLETWTDLEDGLLIWDAGVGRLRFAAVHGIDGLYVEVLTEDRDATTLTVEAHWPIDFEVHHCTARTIWHLIGLFSI